MVTGRSSSPSSEMGTEKSILFSLIENQEWGKVVEWVNSNPSDTYVGLQSVMGSAQANLALHEACKNQPPVDVITALLDANSEAVKVRGQWGYLPLHYACSSGASNDVAIKLIAAYPAGARTKDTDKEALPLHLACKWGMTKEALMSILTTYPEAIYVKDASGKSATNYANSLTIAEVRESAMNILKLGPTLCAASKAAKERVTQEKDCRIKGMAEAQAAQAVKLEARYLDQLKEQRAKVETLTTKLGAERKENENLYRDLIKKEEEMNKLMEKMDKDAAESLSTISRYFDDLEEERATIESLNTKLQSEKEKSHGMEQELKRKNEEISKIKLKMEEDASTAIFFVSQIEKAFGAVDQVEAEGQETKSREELWDLADAINKKFKAMEAFKPLFEATDKERSEVVALLETEREEAQSRLNEAKMRCENLEAELHGERDTNDNLKEWIRELTEAKNDTEKKLENEKGKVENLMEELDSQMRNHMLSNAGLQELIRCKDNSVKELESRLSVHERAEQALTNKAMRLEKMRQEASHDLSNTLSELYSVKEEVDEQQRKLMNATQTSNTYAHRMETLNKWVSSLSFSMEAWEVENDLEQKYSGGDDALDVLAKLNEPTPHFKEGSVISEGEETLETEPGSVKLLSSSSNSEFFCDSPGCSYMGEKVAPPEGVKLLSYSSEEDSVGGSSRCSPECEVRYLFHDNLQ